MTSTQQRRPLSPHLQIYKVQITSLLSILHRTTGIILFFGSIVWAVYFLALTSGPYFYGMVHYVLLHPVGFVFLSIWSFSLCYHLLNGIRHLFWDLGYGYDLRMVHFTGWLVIIGSLLTSGLLMGLIFLEVFVNV